MRRLVILFLALLLLSSGCQSAPVEEISSKPAEDSSGQVSGDNIADVKRINQQVSDQMPDCSPDIGLKNYQNAKTESYDSDFIYLRKKSDMSHKPVFYDTRPRINRNKLCLLLY